MASIEKEEKWSAQLPADDNVPIEGEILLNASGHVQEVDRNFGFWSICAIGVVADNAWGAGGGALVTALYNGGAPGVLYGLIAAVFFYVFIGASLAELSSAIPSSANVYHWASVTAGPKYGRVCSFYTGWWNCLAWIFGTASSSLFGANTIIAMYSLYHPDYTPKRWQIFIAFLAVTWTACSIVLFGQCLLPRIANLSAAICIGGFFITSMVCLIMPSQTGYGYASSSTVWATWDNQTGYASNGFVFVAGMLNGAFAIGTPDGVCHLAEEVPEPKKNIPKGIVAQLTTGFITTFVFYISVLYAVTSLDDVLATNIVSLPLAAMYQQATRSTAGTFDDATSFSSWFGRISPRWRNQFNATLVCGCCVTLLGVIYIGSVAAFDAIIDVFCIFTTMSYLAAFLPHILFRRQYVKPGPFWMPDAVGYIVIGIASAYIIVWNVIFMFPYSLPTSAATMNYSSLISGGVTIFLTIWYAWKRKHGYVGPNVVIDASDDILKGVVLSTEEEKYGRGRSVFRVGGTVE
ncbi:amino acid permease-domain-containing protein [Delphinella strobiligena]|nr:amino acid permease-domain-containing protein [Delphinella strobiligena]